MSNYYTRGYNRVVKLAMEGDKDTGYSVGGGLAGAAVGGVVGSAGGLGLALGAQEAGFRANAQDLLEELRHVDGAETVRVRKYLSPSNHHWVGSTPVPERLAAHPGLWPLDFERDWISDDKGLDASLRYGRGDSPEKTKFINDQLSNLDEKIRNAYGGGANVRTKAFAKHLDRNKGRYGAAIAGAGLLTGSILGSQHRAPGEINE